MQTMRFDVKKIAALAKLQLSDEAMEDFSRDMAAMVAMVGDLPELEAPPALPDAAACTPLREDLVMPSTPREALLQNAAHTDGVYFLAPNTRG